MQINVENSGINFEFNGEELKETIENEIRFESIEDFDIPSYSIVKALESENGLIVKYSSNSNVQSPSNYILRINEDEYIVISTGEIRLYNNRKFKTPEAIKRSMNRLRDIIFVNFDENTNCLFITFTMNSQYATDDLRSFKAYIENYCRNLRYKYRNQFDFVYIIRFEQQKNGNWHAHMLLKDKENKQMYIDFSYLCQNWANKGSVTIKIVKKGKHNSKKSKNIRSVTNYMIKTNQLYKVKSGDKLYITSKNAIIPKLQKVRIRDVNTNDAILVSDNTFGVYKGDYLLSINKKMYYRKPKNSKK